MTWPFRDVIQPAVKYRWAVQTCIGGQQLAQELNRIEAIGWEIFSVVSASHETKHTGEGTRESMSLDGTEVNVIMQKAEITPCFAIVVRMKESTK